MRIISFEKKIAKKVFCFPFSSFTKISLIVRDCNVQVTKEQVQQNNWYCNL